MPMNDDDSHKTPPSDTSAATGCAGKSSGLRAAGMLIPVVLAVFMAKLDTYIVCVSLPGMASYFKEGVSNATLIILSYAVVSAAAMMTCGKLEDSLGCRRIFTLGFALFTGSSLACGLASSFAEIIASRAAQGLGGAMMTTSAYTIVSRHTPGERLGASMGWMGVGTSLGIIAGAPLGGFISGMFSWRWIFFINVPVGVAALAAALLFIPKDGPGERSGPRSKAKKAPFDLRGVTLSFAGVSLLMLALNRMDDWGASSPLFLSMTLGGAFLLWAWWKGERRAPNPIFNVSLLDDRRLRNTCLAALLSYGIMAGNAYLLPFFLEGEKGLSPAQSGLMMLFYSAVILVVAPVAGRLSDRWTEARVAFAGDVVVAVSAGIFALVLGLGGLAPTTLFLSALGAGIAMSTQGCLLLAMRGASPETKGEVSGIYQTVAAFSLAIGTSVFDAARSSMSSPDAGYRLAYFTGALMCAAAAILLAPILMEKKRTAAKNGGQESGG